MCGREPGDACQVEYRVTRFLGERHARGVPAYEVDSEARRGKCDAVSVANVIAQRDVVRGVSPLRRAGHARTPLPAHPEALVG